MKKILLLILCGLSFGGCSLVQRRSGIEIASFPSAKVYIDGKEAGMTPYKNRSLAPGEVEVKLISGGKEWQKNLALKNRISSVIEWNFGETDSESGGFVLYMEKTGEKDKAGLLISSNPSNAAIQVESAIVGHTPARVDDITEGDKLVTISYPGHRTVSVQVKAVNGYRLIIEAKLAPEKSLKQETTSVEETPKVSTKMATIKQTETGWLRARKEPTNNGEEIMRVKPGEKYEVLETGAEWIKLKLTQDKQGWVSAKYVDISEQ